MPESSWHIAEFEHISGALQVLDTVRGFYELERFDHRIALVGTPVYPDHCHCI